MSSFLPLVTLMDPALGKVDKASLSQQTVMELLIADIQNPEVLVGSSENHTNITMWDGLERNTESEVIAINWEWFGLDGSLNLAWVPLSTHFLNIEGNSLIGSVDLTQLPEGLETAWMSENEFEGEVSLRSLPKTLRILDISHNYLNGFLDLTRLPESMENLYLQNNLFSSQVDLTKLPPGMIRLDISDNPLHGETDFCRLPRSLEYFNICHTSLGGQITRAPTTTVYAKGSEVTVMNL